MKTKKFLALLLSVLMLFGLFAVVPVSAQEAEDGYVFEAYEAEKHPGWAVAPTVDGFNGCFTVNATYGIYTKTTYDMGKTSILLNNLTVPDGYSVAITIAPTQYTKWGVPYDPDNGTFTIVMVKQNGKNVMYVYDAVNNGFIADREISCKDSYEIALYKSVSYDDAGFETTSYNLKINEYTISTTDETNGLAKVMNSENFCKEYISITTNNKAVFNAKIEDNGAFIDTNGAALESVIPSADGYYPIHLQNKAAATMQAHDFTEKGLSIIPTFAVINNLPYWGNDIQITLSSTGRLGNGIPACTSDTLSFVISPTPSDTSYAYLAFSNGSNDANKPGYTQINSFGAKELKLPFPEKIDISFVEVTTDNWAMVVNGSYYIDDKINTFMNSGNAENAYVTLSGGANSCHIKAKVADADTADWICDNYGGLSAYTFDENGVGTYTVKGQTRSTTSKKHNLFETTFEIDDLSFTNVDVLMLHFSTAFNDACSRDSAATGADGKLYFDLKPGINNTQAFGIAPAGTANWLGTIPYSDDNNYKINIVEEADGTYALHINDKVFMSDKLTAFCEAGYAESAYISLSAYAWYETATFTPTIKTIKDSHEMQVAEGLDIKDNTFKNLLSYTTVAELKEAVSVGEYYSFDVVSAGNTVRTEEEYIASGDKLVVSFRGKVVANVAFDVVVLGDTDCDADVTSTDLIILKKSVLGIEIDGICKDALNVHYDNTIDILDFIAIKKMMVA